METINAFKPKSPAELQAAALQAGQGMIKKTSQITEANKVEPKDIGAKNRQNLKDTFQVSNNMTQSYGSMINETTQMQTNYEHVAASFGRKSPTHH